MTDDLRDRIRKAAFGGGLAPDEIASAFGLRLDEVDAALGGDYDVPDPYRIDMKRAYRASKKQIAALWTMARRVWGDDAEATLHEWLREEFGLESSRDLRQAQWESIVGRMREAYPALERRPALGSVEGGGEEPDDPDPGPGGALHARIRDAWKRKDAEALVRLKRETGLSQAEIAKLVNSTQQAVSKRLATTFGAGAAAVRESFLSICRASYRPPNPQKKGSHKRSIYLRDCIRELHRTFPEVPERTCYHWFSEADRAGIFDSERDRRINEARLRTWTTWRLNETWSYDMSQLGVWIKDPIHNSIGHHMFAIVIEQLTARPLHLYLLPRARKSRDFSTAEMGPMLLEPCLRFGLPFRLHSDRGNVQTSEHMQSLEHRAREQLGRDAFRLAPNREPYSPWKNGQAESFIKDVKQNLIPRIQRRWPDAVAVYNHRGYPVRPDESRRGQLPEHEDVVAEAERFLEEYQDWPFRAARWVYGERCSTRREAWSHASRQEPGAVVAPDRSELYAVLLHRKRSVRVRKDGFVRIADDLEAWVGEGREWSFMVGDVYWDPNDLRHIYFCYPGLQPEPCVARIPLSVGEDKPVSLRQIKEARRRQIERLATEQAGQLVAMEEEEPEMPLFAGAIDPDTGLPLTDLAGVAG